MNSDQPIIVIKRKSADHAHHGGAWKVAYADFVTAMMAFFLVMWILGLNQDTRKSIAAYFKNPTGIMKTMAGGPNRIASSTEFSPQRHARVTPGQDSLLEYSKDRSALAQARDLIEKKIEATASLRRYRNNVEVTLSREGLRIELLEDRQALFFESGSAALRPTTVDLLHTIGPVLRKLPNSIIVEGHTDARPYAGGTSGYSNMDLSMDRANAARHALEPTLASGQLKEVRGYGASRLRRPEDPFHYANRRISILVPALNYIEGVPTQEADEQGLIGLKPNRPDLRGEFLAQIRQATNGSAPPR